MSTRTSLAPLPQLPDPGAEAGPALPPWKAFVIQLTRDTTAASGTFSGRLEHFSSGHRARFSSERELLEALTRLLAEVDDNDTWDNGGEPSASGRL